jgi:ankyrin repeat protein
LFTAAAILLGLVILMAEGDRLWRWAVGYPIGDELLYVASATGDMNGVRQAIRDGASPNALSPGGIPALAIAASAGESAVVAFLLESGADASAQFDDGLTPLSYAACTSCDPATIRLLVEAGADPNAARPSPPLVSAASHGSVEVVQLLLSHGADPEKRGTGPNTWSPLEAALASNHAEIAALIRRARVRPSGPGRSFPA